MVKIYGYSDDLVEIEGSQYQYNEIDCFNSDVRIKFYDGTVIRIGYPKRGVGVWWIEVEKHGNAMQSLTECNDEDAEVYSDVFEIEAEVECHSVIKQKYERNNY